MEYFFPEKLELKNLLQHPCYTDKEKFMNLVTEYTGIRVKPSKTHEGYQVMYDSLPKTNITLEALTQAALGLADGWPELIMAPKNYDEETLVYSYKRLIVNALALKKREKLYHRVRREKVFLDYQLENPTEVKEPMKDLRDLLHTLVTKTSVHHDDPILHKDDMAIDHLRPDNIVRYRGPWKRAQLATMQLINERNGDVVETAWGRILRTHLNQKERMYCQVLADIFHSEFDFGKVDLERIRKRSLGIG